MTKHVIDEVIKDWGERLFYSPVKGAKGKNIRGGGKVKSAQPAPKPSALATRERLTRTVKKTPEVMVKISGGGKNMERIKAHMDYISRNGDIALEDENGDIHHGKEAVCDVRDAWAKGRIGIPLEGEKRKEAFNIVLSMPPGTDRQSVNSAARAFAKALFANHQYVFASHDDEKHPHVHLAVKAVGHDGVRLNPRKGDLQYWREQFAEKLREQGIAANASPPKARGIVRQLSVKQAVVHIDKAFEEGKRENTSRVSQGRSKTTNLSVPGDHKFVLQAYGEMAKALAIGTQNDQKLALDIVSFVKSLPTVNVRNKSLVRSHRKPVEIGDKSKDR